MAKGITQEQVSAAADTLVTAGERPTVEKVRAKLGTGSPNTVIRMLETWRGELAERLNQVLSLPDVPGEVGQAFAEIWRFAVLHSESAAQADIEQERNKLVAAQTSLMQERKIWELTVAEAQNLVRNAGQAREVAETRLVDIQRLVGQQSGQLTELLLQRDILQQRADELARATDKYKDAVTGDRDAQVKHVRAVEDRAHAEIDRARGETKALQALLRQQERDSSAVRSRLEKSEASFRTVERLASEQATRTKALEQQLARMDGISKALLAAQQALKEGLRREKALHSKLDRLLIKNKTHPSATFKKSADRTTT